MKVRLMKRLLYTLIIATGLASSTVAADPIVAAGTEGFSVVVKPFLTKHCYDCHGDADGEGNLDLTKLSLKITTAARMATELEAKWYPDSVDQNWPQDFVVERFPWLEDYQ